MSGQDVLDSPKGKRITMSTEAQLGHLRANVSRQQDWLALGGALHPDGGRVLSIQST